MRSKLFHITEIIREFHLTHGQIAEKIGVSRPTVTKYASGMVVPGDSVASRIGQLTSTRPIIQDGQLYFERTVRPSKHK
jgi:predicted transcriptional regulator